ncbi:hypothetical protein BDY17DRAFT_305880 [Neohortaea acidophila]|uniref:HOOK N-terminal domain-containing protein n=1 Tax=Neohortaea acidophila TaxID=245834 RepID=A0A6A6PGR4_9PEZI|nr:uncharacterized protein BDY17DRAFT_305880 [Neohortaea acidophila]KAF2478813.1 hypothetical protein BDY17DRAFT_305880 [Neohortaea acidophila]
MEDKDDDAASLSTCLLQWVQSFPNIPPAHNLAALSDGLTLWSILQSIDPSYFTGSLPEPHVTPSSDWTRKWQNLKHIEKAVALYYRDVCNELGEHVGGVAAVAVPDVQAIAAEGSVGDLEKLILGIIRAAMAEPESNQRMAQRLMGLGRGTAMVIAHELRAMEESDGEEGEEEDDLESRPSSRGDVRDRIDAEGAQAQPKTNGASKIAPAYQDPLLQREEELLKAQATIDKMEATHGEVLRQLQELRGEKESLQEAFNAYRDEIESKGRKTAGDDAFKKLQRQADNDRAYIEDLEDQLQSSKSTMENFERDIQRYRDDGEGTQTLRDEVQLLKADNADLTQRIKANENLKKKIQTLQEQETANASLRDEIKHANERVEGVDRLKEIQAALEKEIIEKQGLIRNQEYQINELTTIRRHAEYDARMLAQKLQEARERHERDHETIQGLRGKLKDPDSDEQTIADVESNDKPPSSDSAAATPTTANNENTKHLAEKVTLLQQQLETADLRLKQASDRAATLEDQQRLDSSKSLEDQRTASAQVEEHERTIAQLRKELEASTAAKQMTAAAEAPAAPALPQDLAALRRENHLMATAWFDLSARIQDNGVSLGRRRQEPKSWIGRQRRLVGPHAAGLGN